MCGICCGGGKSDPITMLRGLSIVCGYKFPTELLRIVNGCCNSGNWFIKFFRYRLFKVIVGSVAESCMAIVVYIVWRLLCIFISLEHAARHFLSHFYYLPTHRNRWYLELSTRHEIVLLALDSCLHETSLIRVRHF